MLMTISGFLLAQSSVTSYVDMVVKKIRTLILPLIKIALKRFPYLLMIALFILWAVAETEGG